MLGLNFVAADAELDRVFVFMSNDMGNGLLSLASVTARNISDGVPPPKGAWLSCCFMATGAMKSTSAFTPDATFKGTSIEVEFGMRNVKPSNAYQWAHEAGSPQGVRAKRYFQKGVAKSRAAVKRNPNRFFKRS